MLYRFLDRSPDGAVYIALCFACRSLEANGAAMVSTSSFAIMAAAFSKDVGRAIVSYDRSHLF